MNNITINGKRLSVDSDKTILQIAMENNIEIPTLCFLSDCNNMNECGVCLVEIKGQDKLARACHEKTKDNMIINTTSKKVQIAVRERISEILNDHNLECGKCSRLHSCELLKLVKKTNAKVTNPFKTYNSSDLIDSRSKSIVLDKSKCVKCGRCVAACKGKSGTKVMHFLKENNRKIVGPDDLKCFDSTNCLLCGQCVAACPVGALYEKSHINRVLDALNNPKKHVLVGIAPSIRTSVGEMFKMGYGIDVTNKVYSALRHLGFNKVFDVNFAADTTILEEGTELIERIKNNGPFPMFTSCCPAWIRLAENYYPELLNNISSAKSPQQMFGAISKSYYPFIENLNPEDIFTVSIMPCTAKKFEADRSEMVNNNIKNIDAVLTTRELVKLIQDSNIDFSMLEESDVDPVMGEYTGAATIFGATGGVMEAALRTATDLLEGVSLEEIDYEATRGLDGFKEATVNICDNNYNIAIINGASNFFEFMNNSMLNKKNYHFIEVMACPGGCVNGGGQPHVDSIVKEDLNIKSLRASVLYNQDKNLPKRKSHKNAAVLKMYDTFMGKPTKGKAHELLHVTYTPKNID